MLPRFAADYRTLLWVFVFTPAVIALQFARPDWVPYLSWLSCYFALACGVIAHNHNHCPTFSNKRMNQAFANWISIFYGYPSFAWVPTHNLNHHKYVNTPGDATITWRFTNRHNLLVALTYFFVSSYYQSEPIKAYLKKAREKKGDLYRRIVLQWVVFIGGHVGALALAVALHGVKTGLYVWVFSMGIPGFFALWTIMLFNYEQHVHTDPWSEHNHSRSFDGKLLNFLLFNNGYHAVHHEHAGTHWSKLGELHEKIADRIHPVLNQKSLWWYFAKQYLLAPVFPKLGTQQIGPGPFNPPEGARKDMETADVNAHEMGTNAERSFA